MTTYKSGIVYAVTQNNYAHTTMLFDNEDAANRYRAATLRLFPAFKPNEITVTPMTVCVDYCE